MVTGTLVSGCIFILTSLASSFDTLHKMSSIGWCGERLRPELHKATDLAIFDGEERDSPRHLHSVSHGYIGDSLQLLSDNAVDCERPSIMCGVLGIHSGK